ncbi:Mpo1 family 2-hydroxy fatty acid dioxygenase [Flavicella sediminum]|uniref:Mpo1 family 2-hydroxy fatty acid dioxygenase n=1 Tax=Flavicella sediminum TaxID=2585141 RepID=UPI0011229ECF|nr:Mpo1-like protein [Flavicella sediminum]
MKSPQQWFDAYAESHQNATNLKIHMVCVPVIYYSILGLLLCIPRGILRDHLNLGLPILENWATVVSLFVLLFYLRLNLVIFLRMFLFTLICIVLNSLVNDFTNNFYVSLTLFVIAWIGQFYGHKIEGKKPSFFQDLQFLLIGPPWVFEKLFKPSK